VIIWFRRDLRVTDHPALHAAVDAARAAGRPLTALSVLDPTLLASTGPNRVAFLLRSLAALRDLGVPLVVRTGAAATVVPEVAASVDAANVFVTGESTPYGARRDAAVAAALAAAGRELVAVGSPYAAEPGTVRNQSGTGYRVFTPFHRAWLDGVRDLEPRPAVDPATVAWDTTTAGEALPVEPPGVAPGLPEAGPAAARARWEQFRAEHLDAYASDRDRPDLDTSSRLSPDLHFGAIHPRELLPALRDAPPKSGPWVFRSELAWREFYADVLWHTPRSAWWNLNPAMDAMEIDRGPDTDDRFQAWCDGRTGFPFVDAGMRQLRAEGWMHNRVRMITASFLVKDLHLDWQRGARWFLAHLVDGDVASNQHGWQWTAGTGTDAAPYFRIFNPVTQGRRFDPDGEYVRRWIPELAEADGDVHEPYGRDAAAAGLFDDPDAYPRPIVDHGAERTEALRRYDAVRAAKD
jgi:deoxyribodipyrimidine photo-lyase